MPDQRSMNDNQEAIKEIKPYYSNIEFGNDVETQINLIAQGTRDLLASWAALANKIVVSHERLIDGLDYLSISPDDVKEGLHGLKSMFDFNISEVVWQIEKRKSSFKNFIKIFVSDLSVSEKRIRKRAERYYEDVLIDEAEEDFVSSAAINEYDFTVYISLGLIYMFRKIDLDGSIYCLDNAIQYAKPKSSYYTSFALMHKANILYKNNFLDEARQCLEEAIILSPDLYELFYQMSIIEASSNKEKTISLIVKLLNFDIRYSLKIENEPAFNNIREEIHGVYKEMMDVQSTEIIHHHEHVTNKINEVSEKISRCNSIIENREFFMEKEKDSEFNELNQAMQRIIELIDRKSLLDVYTAGIILTKEIPHLFDNFKQNIILHIDKIIQYLKDEKSKINSEYVKKKNKYFLYSITKGIKSALMYSLIYFAAWIAFNNISLAIVLATLPFIMVWYLNYANFMHRTNLVKKLEAKLNELQEISHSI
ncbi:putative TPR_REGION domain-containing protein [Gammaproteobacteria bacterium]